jgi:hypothetical protein
MYLTPSSPGDSVINVYLFKKCLFWELKFSTSEVQLLACCTLAYLGQLSAGLDYVSFKVTGSVVFIYHSCLRIPMKKTVVWTPFSQIRHLLPWTPAEESSELAIGYNIAAICFLVFILLRFSELWTHKPFKKEKLVVNSFFFCHAPWLWHFSHLINGYVVMLYR